MTSDLDRPHHYAGRGTDGFPGESVTYDAPERYARGQVSQEDFDARLELARAYERRGMPWPEATRRAAAEHYAADPTLAVGTERLDDRGHGDDRGETEKQTADLDLGKLIEEMGRAHGHDIPWEEAMQLARTPVSQLSGWKQSVCGLARERHAVESTKND